MKRTLKLMAMLLCIAALSFTTSCTKEGEETNTNGGSGNGSDSSTAYPFSLGYYHPEKKVKKVTVYNTDNSYEEWKSTFDFTWNGNNLDKIAYNCYSHYQTQDSEDWELNGYYKFSYNDLGYINAIHTHSQIEGNEYGYDDVDSIHYRKVSRYGITRYRVWIGEDSQDPLYDLDMYGYYDGLLFGFDTNGILDMYNRHEVMLSDGNIMQWHNTVLHEYDNKKNPFKDLIFNEDGYSTNPNLFYYSWECAPFICPNNIVVGSNQYNPVTYEYSGDYPIAITYNSGEIRMEIEYY